jgi:hypothetical protein
MERVSAGEILSATFQFIRDHLKAVMIWSAVYLVAILVAQLAMRPFYQMQISGVPSSQALLSVFGIYLLMIAIVIVLNAAIFRAALHPEQREASYLRVGMDELRLFGLLLLLGIAFFIAFVVVALVINIGVFGLMAMGRIGMVFSALLAIAGYIATLAAIIFFVVRLASAGPLTILRKRITIGEAWRLTRGHFWSLFGAYAVVAVILIVGGIMVFMLVAGSELQAMMDQMRHPGDAAYQREMIAQQMQRMNSFGIGRIVSLVISAIAYMFMIALQCGSIATATRLLLNEEEPSSVF